MIPKPTFVKLKGYIRKLQKEHESETKGKTGLAAVPVEIGRSIRSWLEHEHVNRREIDGVLAYLCKQKLIVSHPWGGYMVPQSENAPPIPPKEEGRELVIEALKDFEKKAGIESHPLQDRLDLDRDPNHV